MFRRCVHTALALCLASSSSAFAATIEVALEDFQASGVIQYTIGNSGPETGSAGLFRLRTQNPSGSPADLLTDPAFGFCIELFQAFTSSYETYSVGDVTTANDPVNPLAGPITTAQRDLVRQLWSLYYDPSWEAAPPYTDAQVTASVAFVGTIYEILNDFDGVSLSSLDLASGNFTLLGGYILNPALPLPIVAQAQTYINGLTLPTFYEGPLANLVALTNPTYQDYIVEVVPEASTIVMSGMGLAAFAVAYRRRRAANAK